MASNVCKLLQLPNFLQKTLCANCTPLIIGIGKTVFDVLNYSAWTQQETQQDTKKFR